MAEQSLFSENQPTPGDVLILDLETQKDFAEVGNKLSPHLLKVSVAGVYSYLEDNYYCFEEKDLFQLEKLLKKAKLIVGFNIKNFDLPVLAPYLSVNIREIPVFDIFEEIYQRLGHRLSLNSLAQGTLHLAKMGHGLEAVQMFREGRIEELKKYCLDDVRITKELYEFGRQNGFLFYKSLDGARDLKVEVKFI